MSGERERVDQAVCALWVALAALHDCEKPGEELLSDADVEAWDAVTRHPAVQRRLDAVMPDREHPA